MEERKAELHHIPELDGVRGIAILAVLLFNESMNPAKIAGIVVIMAGVGILGKGAHK